MSRRYTTAQWLKMIYSEIERCQFFHSADDKKKREIIFDFSNFLEQLINDILIQRFVLDFEDEWKDFADNILDRLTFRQKIQILYDTKLIKNDAKLMHIWSIRNAYAHGSLSKDKYLYPVKGPDGKAEEKMFIGEKEAFEQFIWDVVDVDIELAAAYLNENSRLIARRRAIKDKKIPEQYRPSAALKVMQRQIEEVSHAPEKIKPPAK